MYCLIHSTRLCSNVSFTVTCKLGHFFLFNKKHMLAFEQLNKQIHRSKMFDNGTR